MKTVIRTTLIFAFALLSITVAKAQKISKKQARYLAFRKMIDTADFKIILEKAFPPSGGVSASASNEIDISAGSPSIIVSHNLMVCDIPLYSSDHVGEQTRLNFSTANFIYQSQKTGKPDDYQYNILIIPKPGSNDMGNNISQFIISIVSEDMVSVQIMFNGGREPAGYQGYIIKAKN